MEKEATPVVDEFELLKPEGCDPKKEESQSNIDAVKDALKEIRI